MSPALQRSEARESGEACGPDRQRLQRRPARTRALCRLRRRLRRELEVAISAPRRSSPRQRGLLASEGMTRGRRSRGRLKREIDVEKIIRQSASSVRARRRELRSRRRRHRPLPRQREPARWRPWKVVMMIARAAGDSIAAPSPCPARAAKRAPALAARAETKDEAVKTPRPARNIRRRPSRSAARPPKSSRLPKISE